MRSKYNKLSIVIPVFNEKTTIGAIIKAVQKAPLPQSLTREIILVDDCSTDGTREFLRAIKPNRAIKTLFHEKNMGKGAALRTGFKAASGDIVLVQDADLEYDPQEYPALLDPILKGKADVVYGSRFMGGRAHRILYFWHFIGNKLITLFSNMLTNLNLTDMETCYKAFKKEVINQIDIEENRFGFEPEVTAKIASLAKRQKIAIYEIGISYYGRTYEEGKKIGFKDGVRAMWCIIKYNDLGLAKFIKLIADFIIIIGIQLLVISLLAKGLGWKSIALQNTANIIGVGVATLAAFLFQSKATGDIRRAARQSRLKALAGFHARMSISIAIRVLLFLILSKQGMGYFANTVACTTVAAITSLPVYNRLFLPDNEHSYPLISRIKK